jgi:uncharacterized membrane protein YvlD (DUF360 family)
MRRFGRRHAIARILIVWAITAGTLHVLSGVLGGLTIAGWTAAFGAAAWIGILNALVWPAFIRLALPITVLTLGFGTLALNGLIVWASQRLVEGFQVSGFGTGVVIAIVLTVVNTVATSLLAIDDDDFYYRNVVRRAARRRGAIASDVPGVAFLEIDGLAHDILARAIRNGDVPTMARWLRDGSHRLIRWETDWSSQTGASQAGLLHGRNDDIPAFRWWDKGLGASVASSAPRDVMAIEARISNGAGLLHAGGASRANMFSGDAPYSLLTISTVLKKREGRVGRDYFAYFANPYSFIRTLVLVVADIVAELWQAGQQKRLDVRPRVRRGLLPYPFLRAWMTVVQRDLQVQAVIGDLYAGRPVLYTTFSGYDEMAHHAGVERHETLGVLRKLDRQFARIEAASVDAPRPWRFVVLSDHGQSQGATFLQRYGRTLEQVVQDACGTADVEAAAPEGEDRMYLNATVTEAAGGSGVVAKGLRRATKDKTVDGAVVLGREREEEDRAREQDSKALPEVCVMASGNLGLVSFPTLPGRVTLERIQERYPGLLPTLRAHPGIGFVLVRSEAHGAVVLGARGTSYLDEGRIEGDDPLAPFGPDAARKVKRTDSFDHCADLMINGAYFADVDEVAAFEELVGSHGGMGGAQEHAFVLVPSELEPPAEPLLGAESVHRQLRRWLAQLGHDAYRDASDVLVAEDARLDQSRV